MYWFSYCFIIYYLCRFINLFTIFLLTIPNSISKISTVLRISCIQGLLSFVCLERYYNLKLMLPVSESLTTLFLLALILFLEYLTIFDSADLIFCVNSFWCMVKLLSFTKNSPGHLRSQSLCYCLQTNLWIPGPKSTHQHITQTS